MVTDTLTSVVKSFQRHYTKKRPRIDTALGDLRRPNMNYVQVLKDLISIDTSVSPELDPSPNYAKTIDYLEPMLRELGFRTQRVLIPPEHADGKGGRLNLLAHRRNQGKPLISSVPSGSCLRTGTATSARCCTMPQTDQL